MTNSTALIPTLLWSSLSKTLKLKISFSTCSKKLKTFSGKSVLIWLNSISNMAPSCSIKFKILWTFLTPMLSLKLLQKIIKIMILLIKTKIINNKVAPIRKKFNFPQIIKKRINKRTVKKKLNKNIKIQQLYFTKTTIYKLLKIVMKKPIKKWLKKFQTYKGTTNKPSKTWPILNVLTKTFKQLLKFTKENIKRFEVEIKAQSLKKTVSTIFFTFTSVWVNFTCLTRDSKTPLMSITPSLSWLEDIKNLKWGEKLLKRITTLVTVSSILINPTVKIRQ